MTEAEFEARVDAILATETGHAAHRALDLLTNELLMSLGGGYARGCGKWLAVIEGDHRDGAPYPLGTGLVRGMGRECFNRQKGPRR